MFSIIVALNDSDVLVESEDATCQEERLGNVVEQSGSDILYTNHLVSYEGDAAHDEQHRTNVLRDLKACVFHGRQITVLHLTSYILHLTSYLSHHRRLTSCAKDGGNDVPENLQNCFPCLVHNRVFLNVNK